MVIQLFMTNVSHSLWFRHFHFLNYAYCIIITWPCTVDCFSGKPSWIVQDYHNMMNCERTLKIVVYMKRQKDVSGWLREPVINIWNEFWQTNCGNWSIQNIPGKKGIKVGSDVSLWVKRVSTKNAGFSLSWSGSGIKIYPKIYHGILKPTVYGYESKIYR